MDKNEIGLNAGKVWQLLSNNDKGRGRTLCLPLCKCLYWVDDAAYYDKEIPGTVHLKCTPKVRYEYWGTHQLPALHSGDYFLFLFLFRCKVLFYQERGH